MPFCLATDQLMPANDAQALAYNYLHGGEERLPPDVQQSFIDIRRQADDEQSDGESSEEELPVDQNHAPIPIGPPEKTISSLPEPLPSSLPELSPDNRTELEEDDR